MAKFIKNTSNTRAKKYTESNQSFLEILNDKIDCKSVEIEKEVQVEDSLLLKCTDNFKNLKQDLEQSKGIILQRAGYFSKEQISSLLSHVDTQFLRIYNGIYNNEHFIFIAAINDKFEVSSEVNILCTKIPPCPPKAKNEEPNILDEEIKDQFYNK